MTFLASPRSSHWTFSSLMPRSSVIPELLKSHRRDSAHQILDPLQGGLRLSIGSVEETLLKSVIMPSRTDRPSPSEPLGGALTRIHEGACRVLMVVENETVVGLLTAGNIGELLALEAAGRHTVSVPCARRRIPGTG